MGIQTSGQPGAAQTAKPHKVNGRHYPAEGQSPTVRIIVATHKQYRMPTDKMYLPLHVGAAAEVDKNGQEKDIGYHKDNVGENISVRNPHFCELTGLYWAWKHLHQDYIGLCHYRRYFKGKPEHRSAIKGDIFDYILTYKELRPMLGQYKVFVPRKRYYIIETLYSHYDHTHYIDHLEKTREIIKNKYPDYLESYDEVMHMRSGHMWNMMIMTRELLNEYCTWLFDILFTLETEVDFQNYNQYQGRYSGRVGELIFNVWLRQQVKNGHLRKDEIKTLPYLYVERVKWGKKIKQFLVAKYLGRKYDAQ